MVGWGLYSGSVEVPALTIVIRKGNRAEVSPLCCMRAIFYFLFEPGEGCGRLFLVCLFVFFPPCFFFVLHWYPHHMLHDRPPFLCMWHLCLGLAPTQMSLLEKSSKVFHRARALVRSAKSEQTRSWQSLDSYFSSHFLPFPPPFVVFKKAKNK